MIQNHGRGSAERDICPWHNDPLAFLAGQLPGSGLLPDEPPKIQRVGEAAIDVPLIVRRHSFKRPRFMPWNERRDSAILDAPDPDTLLEARVPCVIRLRVGDVEDVILVNEDAARPPELLPLGKKFPVLVENLDAAVRTVGDEKPPGGIHGQSVR